MTITESASRPGGDAPAAPPRSALELRARRRGITRALLLGLAAVGGVAYVPSVWAGIVVGAWWIVALDTVAYAAVLFVFARKGLDDRVRAGTVVAVAALLGVALSVGFGPNGAGALWLCAVPVLAALLFDRRATVISLGLVALTVTVVTALRAADLLPWDVTPGGTLLWILISGNVLVIAAAAGLAVSALIGGLTEAADRTERYAAALSREQAELLEVNELLQQAIEARSRAEARLRQNEKLSAVGTLAAGIAHDMNNLLVPILAGTELVRAELEQRDGRGESDPQLTDVVDRTYAAARAARDLVDRILAFGRPGGEERAVLHAATVFGEAARLVRATLPPDVKLVFRAERGTGAVLLSNGEAHQLLLNLGTNAVQAMPEGGRLTIAVDAVPGRGRPADVPEPASGRFVRLMVTDDGVGMDRETMARIFEPYFSRRATSARPDMGRDGHGLGLSTVHGIVTSAGGFIVPHSRLGAGTVMEVFLPQVEKGAAGVRLASEAPSAGDGRRVLVVDDDEDVRVMAARILERAGYQVLAMAHPEVALGRIRGGATPDLLITDQTMRGMTGIELAAAVREIAPQVAIVLMSGLVDDELRRLAADAEIETVITKPFGLNDIAVAASTALRGHRVGNGLADRGY